METHPFPPAEGPIEFCVQREGRVDQINSCADCEGKPRSGAEVHVHCHAAGRDGHVALQHC